MKSATSARIDASCASAGFRRSRRIDFLLDPHLDIAAELDVGAAAGHVGGDGDRPRNARFGDDEGLLLMEAGVENGEILRRLARPRGGIKRVQGVWAGEVDLLVALSFEHRPKHLGFFDRGRADQHRLHLGAGGFDLAHDGANLLVPGSIDLVVLVETVDREIGWNLHHDELVNLGELVGFGRGRAGHAGELLVEAEIVLERDRSQRHVLGLDGDPFSRLQRLMQSLGVAPAGHHASGEFVDDDDLVVANDVILVAVEQLVRAQRLVDVVDQRRIARLVKRPLLHHARRPQQRLRMLVARLGEIDGALLLVEFEVLARQLRE